MTPAGRHRGSPPSQGLQQAFLGPEWVGYGLPLRAQGLTEHKLLLGGIGQIGEAEHAAGHRQVDDVLEHPDQVHVEFAQEGLHLRIADRRGLAPASEFAVTAGLPLEEGRLLPSQFDRAARLLLPENPEAEV